MGEREGDKRGKRREGREDKGEEGGWGRGRSEDGLK